MLKILMVFCMILGATAIATSLGVYTYLFFTEIEPAMGISYEE